MSILARIIIGTRVPLVLGGALAVTLVGTVPRPVSEALWRVSPHEVANMFARWDTFFYYSIATQGYNWNPAHFTYQNVVFFPLYPLLMRWGGELLGGYPMVAGLIVSLFAFAAAMTLLYRLALLDLGEERAWRVVLLVAVFPYALFFSAVYTESLFFLLTVSAFYTMRRGRLAWAGVCGLLAGLTRPNGWWLAVPLACLVLWPTDRESTDETGPLPLRAALLAPARRSSAPPSSACTCRSALPTRWRGCTARRRGACRCSDAGPRPIRFPFRAISKSARPSGSCTRATSRHSSRQSWRFVP